MAFRISTALPASGVVSIIEIFRAERTEGPFAVIDVLSGIPTADEHGQFYYDDPSGDLSKFYRVVFYDAAQVILRDTGPITMNTVGAPDLGLLVRLDHNRALDGSTVQDALRYCGEGGAGLADVPIRIFRAADFDAFRTDLAIAVTRTDSNGRWLSPVYVSPGMTYAVVFYKEGLYGPDVVRVLL